MLDFTKNTKHKKWFNDDSHSKVAEREQVRLLEIQDPSEENLRHLCEIKKATRVLRTKKRQLERKKKWRKGSRFIYTKTYFTANLKTGILSKWGKKAIMKMQNGNTHGVDNILAKRLEFEEEAHTHPY